MGKPSTTSNVQVEKVRAYARERLPELGGGGGDY